MKYPKDKKPRQKVGEQLTRAGGGEWGVTANEYNVSFGGDKNVLKLNCGNGCTIL